MKLRVTLLHRSLFLSLVLCAFSFAAIAHNGAIRGTITNEASGQPLPNTTVTVEGTTKATLTDALGQFTIGGLQERAYTVVISHVGYEMELVDAIVGEGPPTEISIALLPAGLRLEEVSVTAGARSDFSRVSEIDFRLRPVRTTQDLLRNVPGLFIAQHAGGGKAEQIFLRGFDIDHGTDVNITVDGLPVNMVSHAHGQGYSDLHWVIPETIESFGFGKGPYYAEQGDFATAGYVAFKTRDLLDQNLVKIEGGMFNTARGLAMLKLPFNAAGRTKQTGYVAGEAVYTDGPFDVKQHFKRYNGFGRYAVYLHPNHLLNISASYFSSSWDASGQIPQRAVDAGLIGRFEAIDPTEGGQTDRVNANIQLTSQLGTGATLRNQAYYSRYNFNLYSNFTFFLEDSVAGDGINQHEARDILGYQTTLLKETHLGAKDLTMHVGAGVRYDLIGDLYLTRTRARQPLGSDLARGAVRQLNYFGWWSNALQVTDQLVLNAAVRYDGFRFQYMDEMALEPGNQKAQAGRVSPKLNLSYIPSHKVKLYLNTGVGFHSNDARVAVPQGGREILPAAYGADLGSTFKIGNRVIVNAAVWALQLEQEFVYVGDAGIVEPGGRTLRTGADFSLRYQARPWLFADFDLNYSHGRALGEPKGEDYIPLAPNLTSIGGITAEFKSGFRGSLRYRYIADRPANEANTVTAEGYLVNDLSLGYTYRHFDFGVIIENLFDVEWNEAQFDTESRLRGEPSPVSELHFTPGVPFFARGTLTYRF